MLKHNHSLCAQIVRTDVASQVVDWREDVVTTYQAAREQEIDTMRRTLAERLRVLIGQTIRPESLYVDPSARMATIRLDGVLFRGRREDVRLVRPCAYCGSGLFESPPLYAPADLGYALSPWMPAHPNCRAEDSPYWLEAEL
jgi:hypothetical protein